MLESILPPLVNAIPSIPLNIVMCDCFSSLALPSLITASPRVHSFEFCHGDDYDHALFIAHLVRHLTDSTM